MKKLQDFAQEMGVTDRMIQKHLRTYAAELEGHFERKGPNGTWLDDEAQDIIRSKMRQAPVAIFEEDPRVNRQQIEIEDLREQLKKKDNVLYGLIEKNEALQSQLTDLMLLSAGKEEAEKKVADLEVALTTFHDIAEEAEKKAAEAEKLAVSIRKAKLEVERDLEAAKAEADKNKYTAESWASEANNAKSEVEKLAAEFNALKLEHEKFEQTSVRQFLKMKRAQKAAQKKQAKEEKQKKKESKK